MTDAALQTLTLERAAAEAALATPAPASAPRLSPHFPEAEFTRSATAALHGIANDFTAATRRNARALCRTVLEPARFVVGAPMWVSSGLRVRELNCHPDIGGSLTSEHVLGYAADIGTAALSDNELFNLIRWLDLPYGQLIEEYGRWVHVSHTPHRGRHQALYARSRPGSDFFTAPPLAVSDALRDVVRDFQRRCGLTGRAVDGLVGPQVRGLMRQWEDR